MKSSADPIAAALLPAPRDLDEIEVLFEGGRVVLIRLGEVVRRQDIYRLVEASLAELTGPRFYGKLKIRYKNGAPDLVKIEKTVKP